MLAALGRSSERIGRDIDRAMIAPPACQVDKHLASPGVCGGRISPARAALATSLRHYYPEVVGFDGSSRLSRVLARRVQAREDRASAEDPRHAAGRAFWNGRSGEIETDPETPQPAN